MATQNGWIDVDGGSFFNDPNDWTAHKVPGTDGENILLVGGNLVIMDGVTVVADDVVSDLVLIVDGNASLTTTTATNDAIIQVAGHFSVVGSLTNSGSIIVATGGLFQTGNNATLTGGTVTLAGGTLSDSGSLNLIGATISGQGLIDGRLTIGNDFTIDAQSTIEASGGTLTLSPGEPVLNGGLIEATTGSTLVLIGDIDNTTSTSKSGKQTTGEIEATSVYNGSSSVIYLDNCSISGGSLVSVSNAASVEVGDGSSAANSATLRNVAVNAALFLNQGDTLNIAGTISGPTGYIAASGSVVLDGNVIASLFQIDLTQGSLTDNNTAGTLTIRTDIEGSGTIGDATMVLYNYGTIENGEPTAGDNTLHIILGGSNRPTSVNEVDCSIGSYYKGDVIDLQSGGKGISSFTNLGEFFTDQHATFSINGVHLTNISGGVLSGGTYLAEGGATFDFYEGFSTLNANLTLSDAGTVMQATSTGKTVSLETMLKTIAAGGALTLDNRNYTTANALTLNGSLSIGGDTLTSGAITAGKTSTLSSTYQGEIESATINALVTDAGSIDAEANGTIVFKGAKNAFSGALTGQGRIAFVGNTDTFAAGASWTVAALTATNANLVLTTGVGDAHAFSETNSKITFNGGRLTLDGATTLNGGSVDGTGVLALGTATKATNFTIAGGATLDLLGAATGDTLNFGSGAGRLVLQAATHFTSTISGFGANDTLDIGRFGKGTTFTYTANAKKTGGTLAIKSGSTVADLALVGAYAAAGFHLTTGTAGDTLVTYAAPKTDVSKAQVAKIAIAHPTIASASADAFTNALFDAAFGHAPLASLTETTAALWSPATTLAAANLHPLETSHLM